MQKLEVIYSDHYLKYNFGPGHPFIVDRATRFLQKLKETTIPYKILIPKKATDKDILLVHTPEYLTRIKELAFLKGSLSIDTPINPDVLDAAYYSVGGSFLSLSEALKGNRVINLFGGMHHAGISDSSGFCIFNDHAIAIRKLQKEKKIKKAIIYDLDVHAGQGTQEIFYHDPTVFTVSLHQDPLTLYPSTGFSWQKGQNKGFGFNLNFVLPPQTKEAQYFQALDSALEQTKDFKSDVTVLVLGVDTYKKDPLANLLLDEDSYRKIGERFKRFSKLAILCAGGYSQETPNLWLKFLEGYLN